MKNSISSSIVASRWLLVAVLGLVLHGNDALRCGGALTRACLGETDIRYDPKSTNNLINQDALWEKMSGLFIGEGQIRVNILDPGNPPVPTTFDPNVIALPFTKFTNNTADGSRFSDYQTAFYTGFVYMYGFFGTSSYEKDGSLVTIGQGIDGFVASPNGSSTNTAGFGIRPPIGETMYPIESNSLYGSVPSGRPRGEYFNSVITCLDSDCNVFHETADTFRPARDGSNETVRVFTLEITLRRVTVDEWKQAMFAAYNTSSIPADQWINPNDPICDHSPCPTEEQWCTIDSNCSESPYQEPPASLKPGVLAGFITAGVVFLCLIFLAILKYLAVLQAQRYRTIFARRIAETINVHGSMRALSPEALADEFKRIDADIKDGKLSKGELWEFLSDGKAGEIHQKDFDALFAAIDLDSSGSVDFLEFCAFMGKCDQEYRAARADRGSIVARSARRLQVTDTTARRLSSMAPVKVDPAVFEEEGDAEEEKTDGVSGGQIG